MKKNILVFIGLLILALVPVRAQTDPDPSPLKADSLSLQGFFANKTGEILNYADLISGHDPDDSYTIREMIFDSIDKHNVEVQNYSCVGYATYRAIRKINPSFKQLSPMQIYNQSRIKFREATENQKTKLSNIPSAFAISQIAKAYQAKTLVDEAVEKVGNGRNSYEVYVKNTKAIENFFLSYADPEKQPQHNLIAVMDTDVSSVLPKKGDETRQIIYEEQYGKTILHVIVVNKIDIENNKVYVYDSWMDLKLAISEDLAKYKAAKGSNDLMQYYGKQIIEFHKKLSEGETFAGQVYAVDLANFKRHFYMAYDIQKK